MFPSATLATLPRSKPSERVNPSAFSARCEVERLQKRRRWAETFQTGKSEKSKQNLAPQRPQCSGWLCVEASLHKLGSSDFSKTTPLVVKIGKMGLSL